MSKVDCRRFAVAKVEHVQLRRLLSKVGDFCRPNVERPFDFVAGVYETIAIRSNLSSFDIVDHVEFDFVASVNRPLELV